MSMSAIQCDIASKMIRGLKSQQLDEILHDYDIENFSDITSSSSISDNETEELYLLITRVGTLIVATIYLQLIQNRYMFRSFTVLQCSHQHCVQPVASDVEVVGYL